MKATSILYIKFVVSVVLLHILFGIRHWKNLLCPSGFNTWKRLAFIWTPTNTSLDCSNSLFHLKSNVLDELKQSLLSLNNTTVLHYCCARFNIFVITWNCLGKAFVFLLDFIMKFEFGTTSFWDILNRCLVKSNDFSLFSKMQHFM